MNEILRAINQFFKEATKPEISEVANKVNTNGTYATMSYYARDNCVSAGDVSGCTTDYDVSDMKQVVDIWKTNYAREASESRLITYDELINNLGYDHGTWGGSFWNINNEYTPSWVRSNDYTYCTISPYEESISSVWSISRFNGSLGNNYVAYNDYAVRPVIVLSKSVLN